MRFELRVDGVTLSGVERGEGTPLLLLHGFTGSAEAMAPLALRLARRFRVLAVDLLGHGQSEAPRALEPYRMERCTAQLAELLAARGAAPAHVFGYSMGGRVALALALHHPDCARSLALLGASAGLADSAERAARRRADEALAERIEREGVEAFARAWAALPLFESQQRRLSERDREALRAQRLRNRPHGLAFSLRGLGPGAQPPLHAGLGRLAVPVWLGAGAEDAKFSGLAESLARAIPRATRALIPAAGHAAHLENPDALERELEAFFARSERDAGRARPPRPADPLRAAQGEIP